MGEVGRSWSSVCIAAARSLPSCPTLCDPIDSSPTGSTVPGILQTRTLEWISISFSAWKWKVKVKSLSRVQLLATPWTAAYQAPPSMGFFRQEYGSGLPMPSLSVCIIYPLFWFLASSVRCWNYSSLTSFLYVSNQDVNLWISMIDYFERLARKPLSLKIYLPVVEDLWYFLFPIWHILILSAVTQTQKSWNVFSLASCFYNLVKVLDFVPTYYRFCKTYLLSFLMHISLSGCLSMSGWACLEFPSSFQLSLS